MITIITPWLNHSELIPEFKAATIGAQVIIIDNGSHTWISVLLMDMVEQLSGMYIRNETNLGFATACNQGLAIASHEVVLFLNNDIRAQPGWVNDVETDTKDNMLIGPTLTFQFVAGQTIDYIDGWCIAAKLGLWRSLGGWDAAGFPHAFWEDVDLSWRAKQAGVRLIKSQWPITHLGGVTSKELTSTDRASSNYATLVKKVRCSHYMTT